MDISLCIVVKNAGKHLEKMLLSVQNICKEICAVDTGSNDNTIEILQSFNSNIKEINCNHDFSYVRNLSLSMATQPWILYLNGNEWFIKDYCQSILDFISNKKNGAAYFKKIGCSNNKKKSSFMQLRLFRNFLGVKFRFKIYEDLNWSLFPKLKEKDLIVQNLDCVIYQADSSQSNDDKKNKDKQDIQILAQYIQENPNHWYNYYHIIEILVNNQNQDVNYYKRLFLENQSDILNEETENYFSKYDDKHQKMYLSKLLFTVTEDMLTKDQLHYLFKAYIRFHLLGCNTMNFYLGFVYEKLKKKKSAKMYYRKCINNKKDIKNDFHTLKPSLGMVRVYLSELNFKEAKQYFDIAHKINPLDKEVVFINKRFSNNFIIKKQ